MVEPGFAMPNLTHTQLLALRNMARKHAGSITAFLNIADAQHLTEIGFAHRSRQGWDITPAGLAHLATLGDPPANDASIFDGSGPN